MAFFTLCTVVISMLLTGCNLIESRVALIDAAKFERTIDGRQTSLYTLQAGNLTMQVTNYGARVVALWTADRYGRLSDIAIGYDTIDRYIGGTGDRSLGAAFGVPTNRIAEGDVATSGIDCIVWDVKECDAKEILFTTTLPDGQGCVDLRYRLTDDNCFEIEYRTATDVATAMNLSHRLFFNLAGEGCGTILDHQLTINASAIAAIDEQRRPTGEVLSVAGTPFDFREAHTIGSRIDDVGCMQLRLGGGYDHHWIIDRDNTGDVVRFARLYEPESGRVVELWSNQLAMYLCAGNHFDGSYAGKYDRPILRRGAVVLASQGYPDVPNGDNTPLGQCEECKSPTHKYIYKFTTQN